MFQYRSVHMNGDTSNLSSVQRVGIAGGGQLAGMMIEAGRKLGLHITVLDPDPQAAAAKTADEFVHGEFDSFEALQRLAANVDVLTFEIERIDTGALTQLQSAGVTVSPSPSVLKTIQDKLVQKRMLVAQNIPTANFSTLDLSNTEQISLPCIWKARRDGYDGRGVRVLRHRNELSDVDDTPAIIEELIAIKVELAVVVARDRNGNTKDYPLTEIEMDPDAHVMNMVVAPAAVSRDIERECLEYAHRIVHALNYVGVLAVEFFLDADERVFVNEISPRPHNSGHYTIEACPTSQFEQHLRAVTGRDLGPTDLRSPAATFNLLSEIPCATDLKRHRIDEPASGIYLHDYGKAQARPGRKMGHITMLDKERDDVIRQATELMNTLTVDKTR